MAKQANYAKAFSKARAAVRNARNPFPSAARSGRQYGGARSAGLGFREAESAALSTGKGGAG